MTPAGAAALLGVEVGATPPEIETAFKRRARTTHPDRFVGAPASRLTAASADFVRISEAREVLLRLVNERDAASARSDRGVGRSGVGTSVPPRRSWWLFGAWTGLLTVALVLAFTGGAFEFSPVDLVVRLVPLGVCSTAYALTGRRVYFVGMLVLAAASVFVTLLFASFGSLLALEILIVPLLGLASLGRRGSPLARR